MPCPSPFGMPLMYKYLRIVRKIESCPPFGIWTEKVGRKTGLILRKTFFVFWGGSSPKTGQKNGLNLSEDFFLLVFIILKFPSPPFANPAYASAHMKIPRQISVLVLLQAESKSTFQNQDLEIYPFKKKHCM